MIGRVLEFSVRRRWLVVLVALAASIVGVWAGCACRSTPCPM